MAAGVFVSLVAAISGAHLSDPPVLAFIEILAVGLAGTFLAVAIVRAPRPGMPASMTRQTQPRLILLCGLPGSGKTTVARRLAAEAAAVRLCPDEWLTGLGIDLNDEPTRDRLEVQLWELAQDLLRLGPPRSNSTPGFCSSMRLILPSSRYSTRLPGSETPSPIR